MWQKKKQSIMFAWFPVFLNEINDVVVYIEWIYVTNKANIRHWNIVRTWGMILRFVYTSMMLNYSIADTEILITFLNQELTETMPWESFVFCHKKHEEFISQSCLVPK